ncbi:aminoglycoside phosphotransferase family protein [Nocardiopsis tropica]|uniref:Aminoglycoside phosphotransferase family protein n=1 Tax=Nocardiopsis tropica TaxID=109330 RepID=A0ABU7KSG4_9ACTN|nr:aminoglycoside phosphotransferase family protein [Nocardiopsis umidischolae]MEE2052236.1 aminoglycoside phosphotransferase family protein [Nocardiopsis umidischolae]
MSAQPPAADRPFPADPALDALVGSAFGRGARVREHTALSGGTYNSVRSVVLRDGRRSVLKVAPPADRPRLTYERGLLATEALVYARARPLLGGLVPRVLASGRVPGEPDREYLFLDHLPGETLEDLRSGEAPVRSSAARRDLGRAVAALHTVTGDAFGYPAGSAGLRADTWPEAFRAMVGAVVADARRFSVPLPGGGAEVVRLVSANLVHLAPVRTPALTHFDLWDGNVLASRPGADGGPDREPRLTGIIDAERAFWGDPAADLVSTALFGDIRDDADFLAGYRDTGGVLDFSPGLLRRLALYRTYLYLIMFVEPTPRGRAPADAARARGFLGPLLEAELAELAGPAS